MRERMGWVLQGDAGGGGGKRTLRSLRFPRSLGRLVMIGLLALGTASAIAVAGVGRASAASASAAWSRLSPASSPSGRVGASMAYDAATNQLLLFGGQTGDLATGFTNYNDTWSWNGSTWSKLSPASSPSARRDASMAYDPSANQLLLFGGNAPGSGVFGDTWSWNGSTWSQLSPASSPSARTDASMAYDAATNQLLLFGGLGNTGYLGDTWNWNGSMWSKLSPASSPSGRAASMAFDPSANQLLLFGGYNGSGVFGDTWSWNGSTWSQLSPASSPGARSGASMAYDPASAQLVLFGGAVPGQNTWFNDTWSWNGSAWSQPTLAGSSPSARAADASMAYDPASSHLVLFGGYGGPGAGDFNDTWAYLSLPASPLLTISASPSAVTLGASSVTLKASATLAGGYNPSGTITFTLLAPDGSTTLDTETVTVNGAGTYTTPTGYTLPATGTVVGTYHWSAAYNGDSNNNSANDLSDPLGQVTIGVASPSLTTTASPSAVPLDASNTKLTASATLSGGFNPTGTITFTLLAPDGVTTLDTETVTVNNGAGTYTTPTGYTLTTPGSLGSAYNWNAAYSGDSNNNSVNAPAAQVTVVGVTPTLTATANPSTASFGDTLNASATLSGGYATPGGTITFNLYAPGGGTCYGRGGVVVPCPPSIVYTDTVSVNGNATYSTTTGSNPGGFVSNALTTYQWQVSYSGDTDNVGVQTTYGAAPVTVTPIKTTTGLEVISPTQPSGLAAGTAVAFAGQKGTTVIYQAKVSPAPDGGTVAFYQDGSTTPISGCGAVAVNTTTGIATCSVTYTSVGSRTITAKYSGDTSGVYTASSGNLTLYVDTDISKYLQNGVYNLSNMKLSGAYLAGMNLSGANLSNGNFSGANFTNANLSGANLTDGNFSNANFTGANLSGANLTLANLKGASGLGSRSTTLTNVNWSNTTCPDNTNSAADGGTCAGHF